MTFTYKVYRKGFRKPLGNIRVKDGQSALRRAMRKFDVLPYDCILVAKGSGRRVTFA